MNEKQVLDCAANIGQLLQNNQQLLATAESCTGGWVAQVITSIAGSSTWFDRGFVTYTNAAKQEMLGVLANSLEQYGAVSEQTASHMALGALENSAAQVALSITGVAGPTGGSVEKPVGMVCFAWAFGAEQIDVDTQTFSGDRQEVRFSAVCHALACLEEFLVSR